MRLDSTAERELQSSLRMIAAMLVQLGGGAGVGVLLGRALSVEGGWIIAAASVLPAAHLLSAAAYGGWATVAYAAGAVRRAAQSRSVVAGLRWKGFEPPYPGSILLIVVGAPAAAAGGAVVGAAGDGTVRGLLWFFIAGLAHGALARWYVRTRKVEAPLWGESELEDDGRRYDEPKPAPRK